MTTLRRVGIGVAVAVAAGLVGTLPPASPSPGALPIDVRLTSGQGADPAAGDSIALVMGGTGLPTPLPRFAETASELYLQPNGFTGTATILTTPETSNFDTSEADGARILTTAIMNQIHGGTVNAANPVWVFGYSQSSALSTYTMGQLASQGVPSGDVHFVLVGNTANPNGGLLSAFDIPPGTHSFIPFLNVTLGQATPDLYPTDIYTLEYDGWADFPRYPIDPFSDLNALTGMYTEHLAYLGLDADQIKPVADGGQAIVLPVTADDTLVHYYLIPSEYLPLLVPLRLTPIIGKPLYDLLEPDTRILVNLGYGSTADGWNSGPANVETPDALFPTNLDWDAVLTALGNGAWQGIQTASGDLVNPDTYQLTPLVDNPALAELVAAAYGAGYIDNPHPSSLLEMLSTWTSAPADPSAEADPSALLADMLPAGELLNAALGAIGA